MKRIVAAFSAIPVSMADTFVVGGFSSVVYGVWLTVGPGPAFIAGGAAVLWTGINMFRASGDRG